MKPFKLGKHILKHGLFLAPMAGVTDAAFRSICKMFGAEFMISEMVSSKAMHYHDPKTKELAHIPQAQKPMGIQLFGSEPEILAEAAKMLCEMPVAPDAIDLNMGCPVRKITANGEGSALMKNPKLAAQIVRAVRSAVPYGIPVTVKFRTGWDSAKKNAVEFGKYIEDAGADAVCVHGRTKEQMYLPPVDYETIADVKQALQIPVIGNGGIIHAQSALDMLQQTGCDALMIARGAEGNPWIFEEIAALLDQTPYEKPTLAERLRVMVLHVNYLIAEKGEAIGTAEARKHLAWYLTGVRGGSAARGKLNHATNFSQVKQILQEVAEQNHLKKGEYEFLL